MTDLAVKDSDLTTKARIRNAALELFAEHGTAAVSMRAIAARAGVAVGLVQHHFKTKDGLRAAVEEFIVERHADAVASAPTVGDSAQVAAARDAAAGKMLDDNPPIVDYLRRSLLEPSGTSRLLARLTDLTRANVIEQRAAGVASTAYPVPEHVVRVLVRELGTVFLQPMLDAMWEHLAPDDADAVKPTLRVTAESVRLPPPELPPLPE